MMVSCRKQHATTTIKCFGWKVGECRRRGMSTRLKRPFKWALQHLMVRTSYGWCWSKRMPVVCWIGHDWYNSGQLQEDDVSQDKGRSSESALFEEVDEAEQRESWCWTALGSLKNAVVLTLTLWENQRRRKPNCDSAWPSRRSVAALGCVHFSCWHILDFVYHNSRTSGSSRGLFVFNGQPTSSKIDPSRLAQTQGTWARRKTHMTYVATFQSDPPIDLVVRQR